MKLLISNQHGAIVMALLPFIYGTLLAHPVWEHTFLLAAWFSLYLMSYPFLNLFKGKNKAEYGKWTMIYASTTFIFAVPALLYNWQVLYFMAAMLPLVFVTVYFTKKKDERNLLNDFAGIVIFALAGMGAYYFPERAFDGKIWWVAIYPTLFFIGTTLYVKSVMRERKNPKYLWVSIIFHSLLVLYFALIGQFYLALAFFVSWIRAVFLPRKKLSVKQVGLIELVITAVFFIFLLLETL
ncbi:YwiC-like family protein [Rodentibacter haemolyticus]|uniref:YwiC-like family protein n=1 Tax=Rodentibacter haemolyticus TaxID=2778911 RepID=A0ABX6UXW8_9PAST|nr:YwiC-like family protein [Rodentibacter haemolyticus]QPB42314.1 YwiC-like family protein [Rodentibacter haemolyticus]